MNDICVGRIPGPWRDRRCTYQGRVERQGRWYCGIHDPVAKAERQAAWEIDKAIRGFSRAERQRRERLADCAEELLAVIEAVLSVQDDPIHGVIVRLPFRLVAEARAAIARAKGESHD